MGNSSKFVWTINGEEGLEQNTYIGFFNTKPEAMVYLSENTEGRVPFDLYEMTYSRTEGVQLEKATPRVGS